ncbi:mas-related G-protein coupled receptor member X4-like [Sander lucioperca]|uniref:mas-related G-protein coupled receptor member X4-like n=1 Tax=Sander lucioperca TaxID=283035 RepID=UPI00125E7A3E|nr:mas-related G-protein coupled receptor member X4-like [Sander lucioperca]
MEVNNTTQDNSTFENVDYDGYTNSTSIFTSGSHNLNNSTFGSSSYTNSNFIYYYYYNYYDNEHIKAVFIGDVVTCIIICIGLPLTLIAIYSLYSLVRNDHVAPIYVINLLISDLLQFCCMICDVSRPESLIIKIIYYIIYYYSLLTSVGFMVCIALERYLLIVFPLWYRCRRTIKSTVVICVLAWTLPALFLFTLFIDNYDLRKNVILVLLLLPFPLLIFFCCATLKVLSASVSILPEEKRRIVGTLVLMLLIYTLLFLPYIIGIIVHRYTNDPSKINILSYLITVFLELNPLANLVLYIFMKKGALDKILASVRCCRVEDVSSLENNTNREN